MHRPGYSAGTRLVHVSLRWPETPCGASSLLLHATRQPAAPAGRVSFATSQTGKTALATDPAGLTHRTGPIRVGSVLKRQTTDVTVARRRKVAAGRRQAGRIPTQIRAPQDPTTHPRWVVGVPAAPGVPQGRGVGVGAGGLAQKRPGVLNTRDPSAFAAPDLPAPSCPTHSDSVGGSSMAGLLVVWVLGCDANYFHPTPHHHTMLCWGCAGG